MKHNLGKDIKNAINHLKNKEFNKAKILLFELNKLYPKNFEVLHILGGAFKLEKNYGEALKYFQKTIELKPDYKDAFSNIGSIFLNLKLYEEALINFNKYLKLKPDDIQCLINKGNSLFNLNRFQEAIDHYDNSLKEKKNYSFYFNKAVALIKLNKYEEAITNYSEALKLRPNNSNAAECWSNKATALKYLGKYEEALIHYEKAFELKPNPINLYNKSFITLLHGDFEKGWEYYEFRLNLKKHKNNFKNIETLKSLKHIKNKKILVMSEQGHGDTIQFSRYIPDLINLGANVTFVIQKDLYHLLKNQFNCEVTIKKTNVQSCDYYIKLLSLPHLFKTNISNIPKQINLMLNEENVMYWKEELNLSNTKPNIGFAISGNPKHQDNLRRSIFLKDIKPLMSNCQPYLIQKDLLKEDEKILNENNKIIHLGNKIKNFMDTASIIKNMDLIITIDTSIAHLAGSLNKKTYLLLNSDPDWRWMLDRNDSPWYPSIEIFRQKNPFEWKEAIDTIKNIL